MDLTFLLLRIVQFTAISTFLIFILFVFTPKLLKKKSRFKKYFFHDKKVLRDSSILTLFYIFLFSHLFYFNKNPSSFVVYLIGFLSAMIGLIVALIGRLELRKIWNPITNIYDSKEIIDKGIFSKIRHPIYFGRFMFFLGIIMMLNLLAIFITPFYWSYLKKRLELEEKYLLETNKKYKHYIKRVRRIIF